MAKRSATSPHAPGIGPGGNPFPPLGMAIAAHQAQAQQAAAAAAAAATSGSTSSTSSSTAALDRAKTPTRDGLPPAPVKFDASQAQACRLQDAYWSEEEEDMDCPLCLEEIDLSDANFKPCPCGYQICRFCWHHIKQNLNGRCPACRRKYSDQTIEFKPMTAEEIKRLTQAKKQKERERKELEQMNRKHLANMRVVQKNLVYVVGLNSKLAKEELIPTLRSSEYFGQYGRISKILISKRTSPSKLVMGTSDTSIGVYVTYVRKEDAARAIVAIDGTKGSDGKIIRASYGTTKYCTTYLRNLQCNNPACTYLHEPGEEADSFTKEDLSTLRHAAKDTESRTKPLGHGLAFAPQRGGHVGTNQAGDPAAVAAAAAAAHAIANSVSSSAAAASAALAATSPTALTGPASASSPVSAFGPNAGSESGPALPKTATWASGKPSTPTGPIAPLPSSIDMPPLTASTAANVIARKSSAQKINTKVASNPSPQGTIAVGSPTKAQSAIQQAARTGSGSVAIPVPGAATGRSAASGNNTPYSSSPLASSSPTAHRTGADSRRNLVSSAASEATASASPTAARSNTKSTLGGASTPTANDSTAGLPPTGVASGPPPGLGALAAPSSTTNSSGSATPLASSAVGLQHDPHAGDETPTPSSAQGVSGVLAPKSSYRPSSRAQALLDDLRRRRAPELESFAKPSPFPDFVEATLQSWSSGGDFCFVMDGQNDSADERTANERRRGDDTDERAGHASNDAVPNGFTRSGSEAPSQDSGMFQGFGGNTAASTAPAVPPGLGKFGSVSGGATPPPGIPLPPGMLGTGLSIGMGVGIGGAIAAHLQGGASGLHRSGVDSPAISGYSGSFDPFANSVPSTTGTSTAASEIEYGPGSSVTTLSNGEAAPAAPFAAIDEMRRTLSDEREKERSQNQHASANGGSEVSQQSYFTSQGLNGEADEAGEGGADKRASRFGFAAEKRKESVSGAGMSGLSATSPLFKSRLDLDGLQHSQIQHAHSRQPHPHQHMGQQHDFAPQQQHISQHPGQHHGGTDLLGFSNKDVNGLLGHVFESDGGVLSGGHQGHLQQQSHQGQSIHQLQHAQPQHAHQQLNGFADGGPLRGLGGPNLLSHFQHFAGGGNNSPVGLASTPPPGFGSRVQPQGQNQGHINGAANQSSTSTSANAASSNPWLAKFANAHQAAANQAQGYSTLDQQGQAQHQAQHGLLQHQQAQHMGHSGANHSPLVQHSHLHQHSHQSSQGGGIGGFLNYASPYGNNAQQGQQGQQGFGTPLTAPRPLGGLGGGAHLLHGRPMNGSNPNAAAAAAAEPLLAQLMAGISVGSQQAGGQRRAGASSGLGAGRYDMYGGGGGGGGGGGAGDGLRY